MQVPKLETRDKEHSERVAAHVFDPIAAGASQPVYNFPVGTKDEILREGMDPDTTACCAPREPGFRGCLVYKDCLHNRMEFGGFKDVGPKNVGFYQEPSKLDGGKPREDYMPCYLFVIAMQARMLKGRALADQGKPHELIQIVAIEPGVKGWEGRDEVCVRRTYPEAKDGGNQSNNIKERTYLEAIKVPKFMRPGENTGVSADQILRARKRERDAANASIELTREERRAILLAQEQEDAEATATPSLAEPVKAKPK